MKKISNRYNIIFLILIIIVVLISFRVYLKYLTHKSNMIQNNADFVIKINNNSDLNQLSIHNIRSDILKKYDNDKLNIAYIIDDDIQIDVFLQNNSDSKSINVSKISSSKYAINAQIAIHDVNYVEYYESKVDNAILLNVVNTKNNYIVFTQNNNYKLGDDISKIYIKDESVYYQGISDKYSDIVRLGCNDEVIENITQYDKTDIILFDGELNFLNDKYQKSNIKYTTVENYCKNIFEYKK